MPRKRKENLPTPNTERELTPVEQKRVEAFKARKATAPPAPKVELKCNHGNGSVDVSPVGPPHLFEEGLSRASGTLDFELAVKRVNQVARIADTEGTASAEGTNLVLAAMSGASPQDEIEGMLVAQMISVHNVAMDRLAGLLNPGRPQAVMDSRIHQATKLMRTFTTQVEALTKYRRRGEQKVTVEHVHVYPGGQAIVGNIDNTGGDGSGRGTVESKSCQGIIGESCAASTVRLNEGAEMLCPVQEDELTLSSARNEEWQV